MPRAGYLRPWDNALTQSFISRAQCQKQNTQTVTPTREQLRKKSARLPATAIQTSTVNWVTATRMNCSKMRTRIFLSLDQARSIAASGASAGERLSTSGAKARNFQPFVARLKSGPDTKQERGKNRKTRYVPQDMRTLQATKKPRTRVLGFFKQGASLADLGEFAFVQFFPVAAVVFAELGLEVHHLV